MRAPRLLRQLEEVDRGFFDGEVDGVAQAPAHGGAQLGGQHVGGFDLHELVVVGAEDGADRRTIDLQLFEGRGGIRQRAGGGLQQQRPPLRAPAHDRGGEVIAGGRNPGPQIAESLFPK